jgi:outer membrane lipoprotein SlyB
MKLLFVLVPLALWAAAPVSAQLFRPETVQGAILGGIAGAVIGHNSGDLDHNAWRGAAIGTLAGGWLGSTWADARETADYRRTQPHVPRSYGYRSYGYDAYPYGGYETTYGTHAYERDYRFSHATRGTLLGGLAGAIIGHNSRSRNAWKGAAWGAGAGLILGSWADRAAERRAIVREDFRPVYTPPAAAPAPSVTIINNYYGPSSPSNSANALFGR